MIIISAMWWIRYFQKNMPVMAKHGPLTVICFLIISCAPLPNPDVPKPDVSPSQDITATSTITKDISKAPQPDTQSDNITSSTALSDNETMPDETGPNMALIKEVDEALAAHKQAKRKQTGQADNATDDIIASIIWEIEKSDGTQPPPAEPKSFEELIPEGRDPSLEEEALDAAFAMLRAPKVDVVPSEIILPVKQSGRRRIGIFIPRSGPRAIYGDQVADGVEMAYFQLNDPYIDLVYFDTAKEGDMGVLAGDAFAAEIDFAIGPLFSDKASALYPYFQKANIPLLSLSNNRKIARSGLWVLGLLPEQQMDALLAETILNHYDQIAILSDQSAFGEALTTHVSQRLSNFGILPAKIMVIDGTVGADDEQLVSQLKSFADYKPLEDDMFIEDVPPPFDAVILAGGADFILKVAPLLSYYDLGPDRVHYLGTDLWASAGLIGEPSLQGAYIATISPELRQAFGKRYDDLYSRRGTSSAGSFLSQLGFDSLAVAATATRPQATTDNQTDNLQSPVITNLLSESGYSGYTGAFRLLANGLNHRQFSVFQVTDGDLTKAAMPPKEIVKYSSDASAPQN
ncbi:MAG: penicillin-binding protein activator [Candidatus Puniceispirillaceae bacterium]